MPDNVRHSGSNILNQGSRNPTLDPDRNSIPGNTKAGTGEFQARYDGMALLLRLLVGENQASIAKLLLAFGYDLFFR